MGSTVIDRRIFLKGLSLATLGLSSLDRSLWASPLSGGSLWVGANQDFGGQNYVSAFDLLGHCRYEFEVAERIHAIAFDRHSRIAVAVARRPGRFMIAFEADRGKRVRRLRPPRGFLLQGHGAFSADGRWFYTSETQEKTQTGFVGVWRVDQAFSRIGEFSSHGLEPHELIFLPTTKSLLIANGGLIQNNGNHLSPVNIETMASSLVEVDATNGNLRGQWTFSDSFQKLSLRHVSANPRGDVIVGIQDQRRNQPLSCVAIKPVGKALSLLELPEILRPFTRNNYCGSVAMTLDGKFFAGTFPRDNFYAIWRTEDFQYLHSIKLDDCCGLTFGATDNDFMISSGRAKVGLWSDLKSHAPLLSSFINSRKWDNHLTSL